jgi:glycosyltransferase involved in cell wall biosynthesis
VIGHVGRFDVSKNHSFLLRVAAEVVRHEPRAFFVLVGDGPLRAEIEAECERAGLRDRFLFTGVRTDVPRLLRSFDAFLFPSLREGLPLVGIEAQAASLPIVLSETITPEVVVVPTLFRWLSLAEPPSIWAATVRSVLRQPRLPQGAALCALERSDFDLRHSLRTLESAYGLS